MLASPQTAQGSQYAQQNALDITQIGDLNLNYYVVERPERHGVAFTEALTVSIVCVTSELVYHCSDCCSCRGVLV